MKSRNGLFKRLLIPLTLIFLLSFVIAVPVSAVTNVFINEIHYDNAGTDADEGVEIAGPAGTDLTGWSVVFYNGSGGGAYRTETLSGSIPDLGSGFGVVYFTLPVNGIQNGAPDGLALVDGSSNVVQFLSYEGSFTATDGLASGMTSTDIGVSESSSTPVGDSLQLNGTGSVYEDFTWSTEAANTFGSANTSQTFAVISATHVFINELHYDNASTDQDEGVEIAGPAGTDLTGWSVVFYNGSNGTSYRTESLSGSILDLGGGFGVVYFTLPTNGIQNGAPDGLALVDGSSNVIQFLSYEGAFTAVGGPADGMDSTDIGVSEGSSTPVGFSLQLNGTGTVYEDFTWTSPAANTFGNFNTLQSFGAVIDPCPDVMAIADVQGPGDVTPFDGQVVTVRGFVTSDSGSEFVVQEGSSDPRSGIIVYSSGNSASRGDEVCVTGTASERYGQTQVGGNYNPSAVVSVLSSGNTLPDPAVVSTADIATGSPNAEQWEAVLVRVERVYVTDPALGYGEWAVDDGSGPTRVDDDKGSYTYVPAGGDFLTFVQGPLYYTYNDYKIEPRDDADIGVPAAACADPALPIYDVQGSGFSTPYYNQVVTIQGVVVGDFETATYLNGFFVQELEGDGDPATSDGVFVYAPYVDQVKVGDLVHVTGKATEYYNMTEVSAYSVSLCGLGSVAPTDLFLPVTSVDDFEPYEGMLVTMPQSLYISEYYNFGRYGEIVLSSNRNFQPTALYDPDSPDAADLFASNPLDRITLDDGRTSQNPDPAIHPDGEIFNLSNLFRGGDQVQNVTGVINYDYGIYRVQPVQGADYIPSNPRTAQPDDVGGNLKVASFNVLNYFTTLGSRGADTPEEFTRQRDKIISAMAAIDADVFGLIEIENNDAAIQDLVAGLNDFVGAEVYGYVDTGVIGTDEIKVAFVYKLATVSLVGDYAVLDTQAFVNPLGEEFDKNRPALAQTFMDNTTGGIFTVVVNHLKSKGSACDEVYDELQGNCNLTRTLGAIELANWLATDPTGSGDADFLIIGDLNSYDHEDPIAALASAGYTDLIKQFEGEYAYSYVFDGQLGYLDHALANLDLVSEVTGTTVWHINADEPSLIDYDTTYKAPAQDALYAPDPYRSSDHDPVIVGLDVCDEIAPNPIITASTDELWPAKHQYVTVEIVVDGNDNFDPNPTITLISVVSNEPDDGLGDGDTPDDIVIINDFTFDLRAERSGTGDGRFYTITYSVVDACGNETIASINIFVPHDKGQ